MKECPQISDDSTNERREVILSMQFWLLGTWDTVQKFKDILGNKLQLTIKRKEVIEKERKGEEGRWEKEPG